MSDSFARFCLDLFTAHMPEQRRAEAAERLRTHPHFAILREAIERRDVTLVGARARAVLVPTADGELLFPPHDAVQLPIVARYGQFQRDDLLNVISWLRARGLLCEGKTFVDVGANVGTHTLCAMRSGAFERAIAVEADPDNAHLLDLNVRLSGLADVVRVVKAALGAIDGHARLSRNPLNCGDARLTSVDATLEAGGLLGEADFDTVDVPATRFDTMLGQLGEPSDRLGLVWMDTQGSEGLILGASRVLAETPVPLYVEFWPYGMKALGGYPPLKAFVEQHAPTVVIFRNGVAEEHTPDVLDRLYADYEDDARFLDLLLLRR